MILLLLAVTVVFVWYVYNDVSFGINEGVVVNKQYVREHYRCIGKLIQRISESYNKTLQKEIDGKIRYKIISVPKEEYEKININDYYKLEE